MKYNHKLILLQLSLSTLIALSLAACGGGSGGGNSGDGSGNGDGSGSGGGSGEGNSGDGSGDGGKIKIGIITASESSGNGGKETDLGGFFYEIKTNLPANQILAQFDSPTLDVCTVESIKFGTIETPDDIDIPDNINIGDNFMVLSAGAALHFTQSGSSFAEVPKEVRSSAGIPNVDFADVITYNLEDKISGPLPNGLSVDIPGDKFPAFSNIALPNIAGLVVTSPTTGVPITASTNFTWSASSNPDDYLEISMSNIDFETLALTSVDCTVKDDGSFSFPKVTKDEVGANFSFDGANITRRASKIIQKNGAYLILNNTVSD